MPTCQHTMSVTVSGPFTIGPTASPSSTSSQYRGSAPRRRVRRVLGLDGVDLVVGVRAPSSMASYFFFSRALLRSVRIISRYWPDSIVPSSSRKTLADHSCTARSANSLGLSSTATSALRRHTRWSGRSGAHHSRALAAVEGVHAAQRVALHQVALVLGHRGDLVLADQRVAAHQRWRRDRTAPHRRGGVVGIARRAGCRRRRPRPRCGRCRCWGGGSAGGASTVRARRCAPAAASTASSVMVPRRRLGHRSMEYTMRPPGAPGAVEGQSRPVSTREHCRRLRRRPVRRRRRHRHHHHRSARGRQLAHQRPTGEDGRVVGPGRRGPRHPVRRPAGDRPLLLHRRRPERRVTGRSRPTGPPTPPTR